MSTFHYKALERGGGVATGSVEAGSRHEAFRQLDARGLTPIQVAQESGASRAAKPERRGLGVGRKVSHSTLQEFTHLLSDLLEAGVPLSQALQILQRETASKAACEQWKALHDAVVDGCSLGDAMSRFPQTFSGVYVAMVRAGETGGFLGLVLSQIAEVQNRDRELRSRVLSALIYPAVLMVLAVGVLIFLMVFFIPRFQTIFEGFDAALPLLTRVIVMASEAVQHYGLFVIGGIAGAVIVCNRWFRSEQGQRLWHRAVLRLPVIGPLQARFAMGRFCRMLGTLIGAGVPLVNALRVAKESIGNQILTDAVDASIELVRKGERLSGSLRGCPELFPPAVLEMVSIAEETGRLDKEFVRIAGTTERQLDCGLFEYVTVNSFEPNTDEDGEERVYINNADMSEIQQALGDASGSGTEQLLQALQSGTDYDSLLELFNDSGMSAEDFAEIEDSLTVSEDSSIAGRVNVNTAPEEVLVCVPGIGTEYTAQLVAARLRAYRAWFDDSSPTLSAMATLTGAFPDEGTVWLRSLSIKDRTEVVCSGTARTSRAWLALLDALAETPGIEHLKVSQVRGDGPVEFSFAYRWAKESGNE